METKPFYLTTEFWGSLIPAVASFGNTMHLWHFIPTSVSTIAMAIIVGLYSVSRGNAKSGVPYNKP